MLGQFGGVEAISRPICWPVHWLFLIVQRMLWLGVWCSSSPGHWICVKRHMAGWYMGCMIEPFFEACMRLYKKKYETKVWGTWESNPGPNGCQTPHYPPSQAPTFVIIISNENNIWKQLWCWTKQKLWAPFEWSNHTLTRIVFFLMPATKQNK